MQPETYERIHHLWEQLAEFPASQSQHALNFLLNEICQLIDADNAHWMSALRMDDLDASKDFMLGWRQ